MTLGDANGMEGKRLKAEQQKRKSISKYVYRQDDVSKFFFVFIKSWLGKEQPKQCNKKITE